MNIWHIAQYLSFLRLALAPLAMVYLLDIPYKSEVLLVIVLIGGITDYLDGYMARRQDRMSYFGAILDFTADKVFILSVMMILSYTGSIPLWITLVVMYREVLVMGMRIFASHHQTEIKASPVGKIKTLVLFAGIIVLLLGWSLSTPILIVGAVLALISLIDYFNKFRHAVIKYQK